MHFEIRPVASRVRIGTDSDPPPDPCRPHRPRRPTPPPPPPRERLRRRAARRCRRPAARRAPPASGGKELPARRCRPPPPSPSRLFLSLPVFSVALRSLLAAVRPAAERRLTRVPPPVPPRTCPPSRMVPEPLRPHARFRRRFVPLPQAPPLPCRGVKRGCHASE